MPRFHLRQVLLYNELLRMMYISRYVIRSYDGLSFEKAFKKISVVGFSKSLPNELGERFYKNSECR